MQNKTKYLIAILTIISISTNISATICSICKRESFKSADYDLKNRCFIHPEHIYHQENIHLDAVTSLIENSNYSQAHKELVKIYKRNVYRPGSENIRDRAFDLLISNALHFNKSKEFIRNLPGNIGLLNLLKLSKTNIHANSAKLLDENAMFLLNQVDLKYSTLEKFEEYYINKKNPVAAHIFAQYYKDINNLKKAYKYAQIGHNLGNIFCSKILGYILINGIIERVNKHNITQWYLKPNHKQALEIFKKFPEELCNLEISIIRIIDYLKSNKYNKAKSLAEEVYQKYPKNSKINFLLAVVNSSILLLSLESFLDQKVLNDLSILVTSPNFSQSITKTIKHLLLGFEFSQNKIDSSIFTAITQSATLLQLTIKGIDAKSRYNILAQAYLKKIEDALSLCGYYLEFEGVQVCLKSKQQNSQCN